MRAMERVIKVAKAGLSLRVWCAAQDLRDHEEYERQRAALVTAVSGLDLSGPHVSVNMAEAVSALPFVNAVEVSDGASAACGAHLPGVAIMAKTAKTAKAPARWREVPLDSLPVRDDGWTYADPQVALKLQASLRRHGQTKAVLVATVDGAVRVLDGRRILAAMRDVGLPLVAVCDLGEIPADVADVAALAAELRFETDYARLAQAVHRMHGDGATLDRLASAGPWTAERIGHLDTLATFDWSQFAEAADDGQHVMDWDDGPPVPQPGDMLTAPGGEVFQVLEPVPPVPAAVSAPPAAAAAPAAPETAPAAAPAKGKAKKPLPPPGPSLFDDVDDVA